MKDQDLLKISLITSIIGIFCLFIFLQLSEDEYMSIENFTKKIQNEKIDVLNDVYLIGLVENIDENNKTILLDLVEYKRIKQKAIMFKENSNLIGINDGDIVELNGNYYNGKIILDKINRIDISSSN